MSGRLARELHLRRLGRAKLCVLRRLGRADLSEPSSRRWPKTERLVANVSDGGIDCLSANTNARLDTEAVHSWIRETIKEVLGENLETED